MLITKYLCCVLLFLIIQYYDASFQGHRVVTVDTLDFALGHIFNIVSDRALVKLVTSHATNKTNRDWTNAG